MAERLPPSMEMEEGETAAFGDVNPVIDIAAGQFREEIGTTRSVVGKSLHAALF